MHCVQLGQSSNIRICIYAVVLTDGIETIQVDWWSCLLQVSSPTYYLEWCISYRVATGSLWRSMRVRRQLTAAQTTNSFGISFRKNWMGCCGHCTLHFGELGVYVISYSTDFQDEHPSCANQSSGTSWCRGNQSRFQWRWLVRTLIPRLGSCNVQVPISQTCSQVWRA